MNRLTRLTSRAIAACLPLVMLLASAATLRAQGAGAQRVLGRDDITLYGLGLKVEPGYQTVPKNIATIVSTFLQAPALPSGVPPFAPDAEVVATLRGPSLQTPLELRTRPNTPFSVPPLTLPGAHVLENIRLISGGEVLLRATPDHVTLDVIDKLLVTQVTATALTAAQVREYGIVFDQSNFQAYNFSAAFAIADQPINLTFPVVLPRLDTVTDSGTSTSTIPAIPTASLPTLATIIPDTLKLQTQIPNLNVVGFTLKVPTLNGQNFVVPPIPGVVVIPGDIGFLNQYFSVLLMVGNVAPAGSNLVVTNLKAEIVLPPDRNGVANSPDVPLAMAQTTSGPSPRIQPIAQPGPDGKAGTADDIPRVGPGESGTAEYLVEGRREGSHVVEMHITGTLNGLPVGPVAITGRAAGSVLVRNPKFTLTFTHPEVVSAGEPYTLDVTVTNTSTSPANFVSVNLYPRNVSGATIVGDSSRTVETVAPGDSATLTFNLIAKKSGKVTAATLDSDGNVAGHFALKAAVGELGVPLSPDSLVLPKEANGLRLNGDNPDDLKQAALGLLGKAHAVATAPAAALPSDVRRFSKKVVIDRAIQVAEAGLRVTMGEPLPTSASQLLMDFMGSDVGRLASLYPKPADQAFELNNIEGFDELRRRSVRGDQFAAAVGRAIAPALATKGTQTFHYELAQAWTYRPGHVSILVSGNGQPLPARFSLTDAQNRRVGVALADGKIAKEIPFSDVIDFTNASGATIARLLVIAAPQPGTFQIAAAPQPGAPANAGYTVSVVLPVADGSLRQVVAPLLTFPQRPATIGVAGDPFIFTFAETGGAAVPATTTTAVSDPAPTVLAVIQQAQADTLTCDPEDPGTPAGRVVAVLFSEEVTAASIQDRLASTDITNYDVDGNRVVGVALQPGRRIAFLALRDPFGPFESRSIAISHVKDLRGNEMLTWTGAMQATVPITAGLVSGRVLNADGTPVPFANVRLFALLSCGIEPHWVGISSKPADANGKYQFDYVTKLPARILAVDHETGDSRNVRFNVQRDGQKLNVDIVFLGRGTFTGTTFDERGRLLAGTAVRVSSLTDGSQYGATTDTAGKFTIPGVPVGNFFVETVNVAAHAEFSFSDYMPGAAMTVNRDITLLDVEKRSVTVKFGSLSGYVLRADGITPVAGVPVIVWYRHLSQPGVSCPGIPPPVECAIAMMNTDGQGRFAFEKVTSGELRLQTFDQGAYSEGQARVLLAPNGTVEANVLLSSGLGTVKGIVLDAAQNPVAGARVGGGLSLTTTGDDGKFTLTDVPVGRHAIVAVSDTLGSRGETMVDIVQAGQVVNAAITLAAVGSITGQVVQADGVTPVPNVDVHVFKRSGNGISVVGSAKTNATGGFSIPSIPADTYQVSAFNAGFTDGNIVPASVKFHGQTFRTTIRFRGAGGKIIGKVLDDDGVTPLKARVAVSGDQLVVAGGRVGVEFKQVNYFQIVDTDFTTGSFTFSNLFVGPVTVSAIGQFSPDPISVETQIPAPNATVTLNLQLQSTSQIKGVVLLPNGVQPAGANVVVKYKSDAFKVICTAGADEDSCESIPQGIQEENVVTDAQGRFWLPVVSAGTFTLTVEDPSGRIGTIKGNVKPGEIANLSVRLFGRGDVTVKVLGSNGTTPIPGAHVEVQQLGYPQKQVTFTADNTGTVLLTGGDALPEGSFVVNATDPSNGFAGRARGQVVADGEQVLVKVFLFNAAGTVAGTVFAPNGYSPVPNAEVIVSGAQGPLAYSVTGSDGKYSVGTVPVGPVTVEIFEARTGRRGAASGRVDADGQQVTINVVEAAIGMVKGQVLHQATLDPLKGWTVSLTQQSVSGLQLPTLQTTTGVDGAYSFPGASRGTFTVAARNRDVAASGTARGAIEREGQVVEVPVLVNIVRQLTGGITGIVVSAGGAPVGSAALEFCLPNRCDDADKLQITAGADGTFVVNDVPLGRFSVVAKAQASGETGSAVGEIAFDGDVATVTVVMSGLARITGQVTHANGSAAANVQVSLKAYPTSGCTADCVQSTDGSGGFTFVNIPGRTFTVTAVDPSGLKGVAGGSLNPGEQKTLQIVLEPTTTVSGRVMTSAGQPAHGAVAELILNENAGNERRLYRETGVDGTFDFPAVPFAPYTLVISDPLGPGIAKRQGTIAGPLAIGDVVLDEAPPQVASLNPAAASRGVALGSNVTITFTEPIQPGTINADNVVLLGPNGPVLATLDVTTNDTVVVLDPLADLKDETVYTVRVNNVKDRVQKLMPAPYAASFTTLDVTRPTVIEASPAASASGVSIYTPVRIKFSEAIDTAKFNGTPIAVTGPAGAVAGQTAFLFGNTVLVFTPNVPLAEDATYQVAVKKATDLSGLEQAAAFGYGFKTTSRIPPTLADLVAANDGKVIEGGIGRVTATPSATSDVLFVDFYINGVLSGTDRISPFEFAFQAAPQLGAPGASVTVSAIPTDTSGNRGVVARSVQLTIVADQPPAVTLNVTTPTGTLTAKNGDRINLTVQASDDVGVKQLGYRAVTGDPADALTKFYTPAVIGKTESFGFNIPASAAPGSTITVQASAIDTKGQVVQATPIDVTVIDAVQPVVEITGATTGTTLRPGQTTTVLVTAEDLGGIANVTFVAGGLVVRTDSRAIAPPQNSVVTSFSVTVPTTALPGQTLTLDALATDRAGNVGTAARVILPIADTVAPTAKLYTANGSLEVAPGQTVSVIVEGEDEGLVSELRLAGSGAMTFSDAKQITPLSGSASRTFELIVPAGIAIGAQIQLTATAVDLSGNVSTPKTLTLTAVTTVNVTLPTSQIVKAGKTVDVTMQLGQPAPAGGLRIDLSIDDPNLATASPFVLFAEGETSRTFQLTGLASGTTSLRARYQTVERASMTVTVSGGNVTGTVFDSRLNPVAGAQLTVSGGGTSLNVISAADGTYVAEGIPGPYVTVKALDPLTRLRGFSDGTMNATGGSITLSVVLIPGAAVEGTVFLADGTTPAGEHVQVDILEANSVLRTVFTDAQGRYAFPLVMLGQYAVRATAEDGKRGIAALTLVESGQEVDLPIVYLGEGSLTITVKNGNNAPVPNAALTLRTWDVFGAREPILTNANPLGKFTFDQVPVGGFSLEARDQGTGQAGSITGAIVSHQQALSRDVVIASFGAIHGTVFRADGTTVVVGAQVYVSGRLTTTNESGQYRFDILPLGNYAIRVNETGTRAMGSTTATIALNGQDITANITLMPQGRLLVTVRDANDVVVPNAFITAELSAGSFSDTIRTTASGDGTALIEHVLAGTATVRAESGALAGTTVVSVAPNALVEVTIKLEPTGQITGTVYEPDGQTPANGGSVRLNFWRVVPIGPGGVYKADLTPKGDYDLAVYDSNSRLRAISKTPARIETNGQVVTRDFTFVGLGKVKGQVLFSDGRPAQSFGVTLSSANAEFGSTIGMSTDAAGNFLFENVPAGAFTVSASDPSQQLLGEASGAITVHGKTETADIILTNNAVTLPQTLYDGNAYPFIVRRDGQLGTNNAFGAAGVVAGSAGGASVLEVVANGVAQAFQGDPISTVEDAQREFATREANLHGLIVTRKIAVPLDGYFSRELELLTNPGTSPITVDVRISSTLRPAGGTLPIVQSTSSGDGTFTAGAADGDAWVTFRDGRNAFGQVVVPGRAFVVGKGGNVPLGIAAVVDGNPAEAVYGWTSVTVQPGQTIGLLHFVVQQTSGEAAQAAAERLVQLPPEALQGLSLEEIGHIVNFTMPADGHSTVAPLPPLAGTINGQVFDGDTPPTATPSAQVFLESTSVLYRRTFNVPAGSDGRFSFTTVTSDAGKRLIPQMPFTLTARYPRTNAMSPSVTGQFPEGSAISVTDVAFTNTGAVAGAVTRSTGQAVQSGTVQISGGSFQPFTVDIGDDSKYRIAGLPPGTYTLTASVPVAQGGTNLTTTASVTIAAGATAPVTLVLPQTFTISGAVLRASTAGAPGVKVTLTIPGSNSFSREVTTSTGGAFAFFDVMPGTYAVAAKEPQTQITSSATVSVTNAPVTQNLTLIAVGSVTGKISLTTGLPAVNRSVTLAYTLASGAKAVLSTTTNGSGDYAFTGVPASTFVLEVNDTVEHLYGTAEGRLQTDGENVKINFTLTVNTINLPATRYDANGFQFTLNREAGITNNGVFASEASILQINTGSAIVRMTGPNVGVRELGGRQIRFTGTAGQFAVTRKVYVPSRGYFARYVDTFHNPTSQPLTLEFYVVDDFSSGWGTPFIHKTSSGDNVLSATGDDAARDRWAIFDDFPDTDPIDDSFQIPAVGSVWAGIGGASAPGELSYVTPRFGLGGFTKRWTSITLQPNEKFSVLHFLLMQTSRAAAQASVERLAQLPEEAIEGLTDEDRATIRNFIVPQSADGTLPPLPSLEGTVQGHVYGPGDSPVSDATVRLKSTHPIFARTFQVTTGTDGAFSFIGSFENPNAPIALAVADYTLQVSLATTATATVTGSFPQNESVSTTDVRLLQTGSVTGILRRSDGTAVPNDTVSDSFGRVTSTDENGRFTFQTYRPGSVTLASSLQPRPGQFGSDIETGRTYTVVAGQTVEGDLTFPPSGTLQGTISRGGVAPAGGVMVSAYGPGGFSRWTITDDQGHYRLDDLIVGAYQVQAVEPRTQLPTTVSVAIVNNATVTKDLALIAVGTATITVKLANGQPAVGASVWFDPSRSDQWSWSGATDGNGVATIDNVPASTFAIRASHPLNSQVYAYGEATLSEEGQNVQATITLPPTGTVKGVARSAKGLPIPWETVYLFNAQPDAMFTSVNADGQGNFTFTGVPAGRPMHLTIYHPWDFNLRRDGPVFTLAADGDIHTEDITRAAMAQVAITATRPNGTKWSGLSVYANNAVYPFYQFAGSTDGNGALTLWGVPEGAFSVRFFDPATGIMLHEAQGAVLPANDDGIVNLAVQIAAARGGVSGTVFAADGSTTVTGAIVQIFNADDGKFVAQTTSSATGAYSFANMIFSQGGFRVRAASKWDANLAGTSTGTIGTDGQSVVTNVSIPAVLGSISGTVTTPGGDPIPGAFISILDPGAASEASMTNTSATGSYQIVDYLAPLTGFNVIARAGGVTAQAATTFATQHETATRNFELGVRNVAVQVRVLGGDAATPVRSAFVEVHAPDDAYLGGGSTNANGLVTVGPMWVPLAGISLFVDYRNQTEARLNVPVFDPAIPIDLVMPMSVVKGRVLFANLTATNRPNVFAEGADGITWQAFDTTATGDYVVFGAAVGPIQLTGQDRFSGLRLTVDDVIVSIGTAVTRDIVLPPTGTVQGTLFDDKGAPMPGQTVELASQGLEFTRWSGTDANGKFTFTDVPAGVVAVYAAPYTNDGQVFATAAGTVVANATLTLDLHPVEMTTVTGIVVDAAGVPFRSAWIELEAFGGGTPSAHFSDWRDANDDGTFTFDRVPVGPIKLTATTWSGTQGAAQFLELTPATPPVTLTLGTGAPLETMLTADTGFVYGITSSGSLTRGAPASAATSDWAYSSTYDASTNRDYFCCVDVAALSLDGRELTVGPLYQDMLLQTRKVFVPLSGAFVRYLEIIENPLPIPMKATVQMWGYIRQSSTRTKVVVAPADTGNTYVVLDDTFGGRTPTAAAIAHVVRGAGSVPARTAFTSIPTSGQDNYTEYQWTVTVPPNGKVALMHFSVLRQPNNAAGAQSQAVSLVDLTDPEALAGLTAAEKAAIKNFIISGVK